MPKHFHLTKISNSGCFITQSLKALGRFSVHLFCVTCQPKICDITVCYEQVRKVTSYFKGVHLFFQFIVIICKQIFIWHKLGFQGIFISWIVYSESNLVSQLSVSQNCSRRTCCKSALFRRKLHWSYYIIPIRLKLTFLVAWTAVICCFGNVSKQ